MKILIAVHSCIRDSQNGFNQACRQTWLNCFYKFRHSPNTAGQTTDITEIQNSILDYAFFIGNGNGRFNYDEIQVSCPDDYLSLPFKTKAVLQWAIERNYDHIFKCDTDTFVFLPRLLATDFYNYDFVGAFNGPVGVPNKVEGKYAWVSGGAGYWLSNRAAQLVVKSEPNHWAEDLWVSQVVSSDPAMKIINDDRYGRNPGLLTAESVSVHYCSEGKKRRFNPQWLHDIHNGRQIWG